ncbi:hypothetical protein BA190_24045 [Labrys sp. WJW]|nr:hypothetical protein BA190_24045 [Labrys sp. WJW]
MASIAAAIVSVVAVFRMQRRITRMEQSLRSKYRDLPPTPDVEDPRENDDHADAFDDNEDDR